MSHFVGLVLGLAFWATVVAIVVAPIYFRSRDRQRLHETLRLAYEKGQPVPPELIAALQSPTTPSRLLPTRERDLRRAIVLIAVGLGFCGAGYAMWFGLMSVSYVGAYVTGGAIASIGAIPGLIGLAYLVLWLTKRDEPRL